MDKYDEMARERDEHRVLESLRLKFTSGNGIPVTRAYITREEYEVIASALRQVERETLERTANGSDVRRCPDCNAPRKSERCWKCNAETFEPAPEWVEPALPSIERIRALAREMGYAIGVHGSQERDLDLIAAPWIEDAIGPTALMEHIAAGIGAGIIDIERKPLGRYAATLQMEGWFKDIDLSVCPRSIPLPANELPTTQELADGYVRVPRTPTKAMLEAAVKSRHGDATYRCVSKDGCYALEDEAAEDYRAMIQAAEKGER